MQRFQILLLFTLCIATFSCTKDKIPDNPAECTQEFTYTETVKSIVINSCAYSGCHDGASAPGDFRSYEGMLPFLANSEIFDRTISVRDMPPNYATDGPTDLSSTEITIIKCWIEYGYLK